MKAFRRALVAALVVGILAVASHLALPEGLHGAAWALAFADEEDTQYAPGYSGWAFRKVRVGESQAEVLQALGPPLKKSEGVGSGGRLLTYWMYSISPSDTHFHQRWLLFEEGRVVIKVSDFYVD